MKPVSDSLTFAELRAANQARLPAFGPHGDWTPSDWATATAGELGEACNFIKKIRRGDQGVTTGDVAKELADTATYLDFLAWSMGIDLGEAVRAKFNEVSERIGYEGRL